MAHEQMRLGPDETEQSRRTRLLGAFLVVLLASLVSLTLAALAVGSLSPTYAVGPRLGLLGVTGLIWLITFGLRRMGQLQAASWTLFLGCTLVVALTVFLVGFRGPESVLFLLLIVVAGMLVGGRASLILAGLAMLSYASAVAGELGGLFTPPFQLDATSNLFVTVSVRLVNFGLMGLLAWFFAQNLQAALRQARQQAAAAQAQSAELAALKEDLERRVAARTQELTQALETVAALSAPVIPVAAGVIILPLVGHADEARMHHVIASLLAGIRTHRARIALCDVTGLTKVDADVAAHLVEAAQGAQLLGCELVLVGMRVEVARALMQLGIDLAGLSTRANLQSGIEYALRRSQ